MTIYLDHSSKGRGYGRALYDALEQDLKDMGILDIANNADKALYYAKSSGKNAIYQQAFNTDANGNKVSYNRIDF